MYASHRHTILLSLFITKEQRMTFDYFQRENFEFAELAKKMIKYFSNETQMWYLFFKTPCLILKVGQIDN